jgi:hypothetical protein
MKTVFGRRKSDGVKVYITSPSWDCGWYWSFGYLGNKDERYHLSGYVDGRNINMYDALLSDYDLNPKLLGEADKFGSYSRLWTFCELAKTAYLLKETAEVLGRGGSHYSANPCKDIITNTGEVERINKVVLPAIFAEIEKLFC